jgi:hypothetical protein
MHLPAILALGLAALALTPADAPAANKIKWLVHGGKCNPPRKQKAELAVASPSDVTPLGCCPNLPAPGSGEDQKTRPNVILFVSDDQGECHYGQAGSCRSVKTGADIPAPSTPNLDALAAYGTVFPIAHNTSSWCFPSLNTIVTGRYQRDWKADRNGYIEGEVPTIAKMLRRLTGVALPDRLAVTATSDPDSLDVVGGYCTLRAGKFALGDDGFNAETTAHHNLARVPCEFGGSESTPKCGADRSNAQVKDIQALQGVYEFIDQMVYEEASVLHAQRFFVWYAPRLPHTPLTAAGRKGTLDEAREPIIHFLFGDLIGSSKLRKAGLRTGWYNESAPPPVDVFTESKGGSVYSMYGNVWWADDSVRAIWKFLHQLSQSHCRSTTTFRGQLPAKNNGAECSPGYTLTSGGVRDLWDNTVMLHLSDNGYQLPHSKHNFTENAFRTRIIVFDPGRSITCSSSGECGQGLACSDLGRCIPDGSYPRDPRLSAPEPLPRPVHPVRSSPALAHAVDIFRTVQGLAIDEPGNNTLEPSDCTEVEGQNSVECRGRDLRPFLFKDDASRPPPENLRPALCGHRTQKPDAATTDRYLLTRPGTVGRCVFGNPPSVEPPSAQLLHECTDDAECQESAQGTCVGGSAPGTSCAADPQCAGGVCKIVSGLCLGGYCQPNPPCVDDDVCTALGGGWRCALEEDRWCRVSRSDGAPPKLADVNTKCTPCSSSGDCGQYGTCTDGWCTNPTCPACVPQTLKLYVNGASDTAKTVLTDLFLEPDEVSDGVLSKTSSSPVARSISRNDSKYAGTISMLHQCINDWWGGRNGTQFARPAITTATCKQQFACGP